MCMRVRGCVCACVCLSEKLPSRQSVEAEQGVGYWWGEA